MPLRLRLISLVAVALSVSIALGGAVTLLDASRSVRTEMRSALIVGEQSVDNVLRGIDTSPDPQHELDDLVASFKGSRHLRVTLTGGTTTVRTQPVGEHSPLGKMPKWFIRLINVPAESHAVLVNVHGQPFATMTIETDPRNEIREVWNELTGSLLILALFGGGTIPLIYLFIGRALRPLDRLAGAMEQVGQGDYSIRVSDRLTPELVRLRDSFNRMASRLAAIDADNHRLHEQLLTLQDEERSDLARDLHDEVGPFLFAINVDVANMTRLFNEQRIEELPDHLQSVGEAARHVQQQVRGMLSRLRPIGLAECGLGEAIGRLIEFWARRYPDIEYQAGVAPDCESLGDRVDTTIYRVVQECLSNAVRHGKPRLIAISVNRDTPRDEVLVEVADDGLGLDRKPELGYGLIGMDERVRAMGGRLTLTNQSGGGLAVRAALPWLITDAFVPLPEVAR